MTATPSAQTRILRRLFLTLMMRGRRQKQGRPGKLRPWTGFALSLLTFALVGLVALALPRDTFLLAGCLHSFAFVMVGLNLATTSGQLLFNPEEAEVLLHRPIAPRALLGAKLQTIGIVSLALAVALSLAGMVLGVRSTEAGWLFLPAHLVSLTLEVLFAAGFIVLAYNLCLRWFGRERLDNLMTMVQVTAAVSIMIGGQIVPRLLRGLETSHLQWPEWIIVFPPIWFAALDMVLTGLSHEGRLLLPAGIGLLATALVVWLGVVHLAADYELGLETLNESAPAVYRPGRHGRLADRLRRWPLFRQWLRDPVEAATFRLTLAYLGRARGVKLRVYPLLAQMLVIPMVTLFGGGSSGRGVVRILEPYTIAYVGFFLAMLPVLVLETMRNSEDHEATTIFHQAPLAQPSGLFHGTRKAILTALCLPGLLLVLAAGVCLLHDRTQLVLLVPGLLLLPVFSLLPTLFRLYVPFAEPVEGVTRGLKTTLIILGFQLLSLVLAGLSGWLWGRGGFWWWVGGEAVVSTLVGLGLRRTIRMKPFPTDE